MTKRLARVETFVSYGTTDVIKAGVTAAVVGVGQSTSTITMYDPALQHDVDGLIIVMNQGSGDCTLKDYADSPMHTIPTKKCAIIIQHNGVFFSSYVAD